MGTTSNERFIAFSKPFVDAIKNIFSVMLATELVPKSPSLKMNGEKAKGDISVVMGLNGKVEVSGVYGPFIGMMVLSFDMPVYLKISGAILMSEFKEFSDDIKDVGAEISNITTGNAKKTLRDMGYLIELSVPSTIYGKNHEVQYPKDTQTVVIPFECSHGAFVMELCYQDLK